MQPYAYNTKTKTRVIDSEVIDTFEVLISEFKVFMPRPNERLLVKYILENIPTWHVTQSGFDLLRGLIKGSFTSAIFA